MEDSNQNAHLNIETVTPDTEKDGQPNDQKYNHRVENEGRDDSTPNAPDDHGDGAPEVETVAP
jgi:hypothetical protein